MKIPSGVLKLIMIIFPLIFFIIIFIIIGVLGRNMRKMSSVSTSLVSSSSSPSPTITYSRWATDSGILEIRQNFRNIYKDLNDLDLDKSNFFPPKIDFDLGFNP